eukprot:3243000-Pleurochrysis_carterae.AAC.2
MIILCSYPKVVLRRRYAVEAHAHTRCGLRPWTLSRAKFSTGAGHGCYHFIVLKYPPIDQKSIYQNVLCRLANRVIPCHAQYSEYVQHLAICIMNYGTAAQRWHEVQIGR